MKNVWSSGRSGGYDFLIKDRSHSPPTTPYHPHPASRQRSAAPTTLKRFDTIRLSTASFTPVFSHFRLSSRPLQSLLFFILFILIYSFHRHNIVYSSEEKKNIFFANAFQKHGVTRRTSSRSKTEKWDFKLD